MPFEYAVEQLVPTPTTPEKYPNRYNSDREYHVASEEVATTNEDGFFRVTKNNGDALTLWMPLHGNHAESVKKALSKIKPTGEPLQDALQEELAIGDYVMMALNPAELSIAKVLAFSTNQVRLLLYGRAYNVTSKNPSGLVKINPNILSD